MVSSAMVFLALVVSPLFLVLGIIVLVFFILRSIEDTPPGDRNEIHQVEETTKSKRPPQG